MKLFISYASRDLAAVEGLHDDLERSGYQVWRDAKVLGGQEWWDRICTELRESDAIVFAVSPSWLRSKWCQVEVAYAEALRKPIVPVKIVSTPLTSLPALVRLHNLVPYISADRVALADLVAALGAVSPVALPDPLPAPPDPPLGELPDLLAQVRAPGTLDAQEQEALVARLRRLCDGGDDSVLEVVRLLRARDQLLESVARDLDELLDLNGGGSGGQPGDPQLLMSVASLASEGTVTPILGHGLVDSLVGSSAELAQALANEFHFPLARHLRDDLPQVSQFAAVSQGRQVLLKSRARFIEARLRAAAGDAAPPGRADLDELYRVAWDQRDPAVPDAHALVAGFDCPVYVTAHPAQLLEHALRKADPPKDPVTAVCRWRPEDNDANWPPSPFEAADGVPYRPTPERPLVFHVFGLLSHPKTLVLTEDDYFRFLLGVASQRDKVVPAPVRSALADSALLVLGFGLDDWEFRTLWQAIIRQEGSGLADDFYTHIAAQVDPSRNVVDPAAARAYLAKNLASGPPKLDIFWGSLRAFTAGVAAELAGVSG